MNKNTKRGLIAFGSAIALSVAGLSSHTTSSFAANGTVLSRLDARETWASKVGTVVGVPFPVAPGGPNPNPGGLPGPNPTGPGGGVFSVSCTLDHQDNVDPIVFFGQSGATHFHDFFGATGVNASTTIEQLRGSGTTCGKSGDTAAYWAPSLVGPGGNFVQPSNMLAYYQAGKAVRAFPRGLKMIADFGGHPKTGLGCNQSGPFSATPVSCPRGTLKMHVHFPFCWDGVNLDSPDHRSHMSFTCDAAHPIELVHLHVHIQYNVLGGAAYQLAPNPDGSVPGVHSDFMNGWHQATLENIVATCINAGRDCKKMPGRRMPASSSIFCCRSETLA